MPDAETFDAFYARTVWNVTSQMHVLAEGDGAADHAIREAYARAYQQWYEISVLPDTEAWVLTAAKDAYQRRRPGSSLSSRQPGGASPDEPRADSTWPGIYRPRAGTQASDLADPDATMAPPAAAAARGRTRTGRFFSGDRGQAGRGAGPATQAAGPAAPGGLPASGPAYDSDQSRGGQPYAAQTQGIRPAVGITQDWRPGDQRPPGIRRRGQPLLADRRKVIAAVAVLAVLVAGAVYFALGSNKQTPTAGAGGATTVTGKSGPRMLPAGRTGTRSQISWSLIGAGWTLAENSTATPDQNGQPSGPGTDTIYLIDPEGGKYRVTSSSGGASPQLLAWSGNTSSALLASGSSTPGTLSYSILNLKTGQTAPLPLPAGVNAVGFTRPDGLNILAVRETGGRFRLERYNLEGVHQASLASLPHRASQPDWEVDTCGTGCGALSSPTGDTVVWGIAGDEMQVVSNAGGHARKLRVPDSGSPPSCVPLSWWNDTEVLAYCASASAPYANELWLVPTAGGQPTTLTAVSGSGSGSGDINGGWQLGNGTYVTQTSSTQCATAASGPGGLGILSVGQNQATNAVKIPGTTGNHADIVATVGSRLLVLAQTSCPGSFSLLWVDPSGGSTQPLLTAPSGQTGIIAAVPYGNGPTATSGS